MICVEWGLKKTRNLVILTKSVLIYEINYTLLRLKWEKMFIKDTLKILIIIGGLKAERI